MVRNMSYKPQIMTAQKFDTLTQTRRAEEERVTALLRYKNESQRLFNAIKNERQMLTHGESNQHLIACEKDVEKDRHEALRRESIAKKEEDEKLKEKEKIEALQKLRIEREIQRICESSDELKELEKNIKIAYVNKERSAQHQESLLMKKIDRARDELIEQHMEEQRKNLIKSEELKESARREKLVAQKIELQNQMQEENEVSY